MPSVTTRKTGTRIKFPPTLRFRDGTEIAESTGPRSRGPSTESPAGGDLSDALLRGLLPATEDLELADKFDLIPVAVAEQPASRSAPPSEAITIEVPLEASKSTAILIEKGGIYEWQLPAVAAGTPETPGGGSSGSVAVFELAASPAEAGPGPGMQSRGLVDWAAGVVLDPVRAFVFKWTAGKIVGAAADYLERNTRTGLITITTHDPATWIGGSTAPPVPLAQDRPARLLLLIHGTFSSTAGSFGALGATASGKEFLKQARETYDAVLAFDHKTLTLDPRANAEEILKSLGEINVPKDSTVDIVCFSRGGLIARLLVEEMLAKSGLRLKVEKAVFVGCTNGGTQLADPENWKTLLDLYTNLAMAAGRGLALFDAGIAGTVVTESVKTLGGFVQAIVDSAIEAKRVPGIAAMSPKSDLVQHLNRAQDRSTAPAVIYYALGSDFEPGLRSGPPSPLPDRLLRALADYGADRLMGKANDLVVDNAAMTQFGSWANRLKPPQLWGANRVIFHTNYFAQDVIVQKLSEWLFGTSVTSTDDIVPMSPLEHETSLEAAGPPRRGFDGQTSSRGPSKEDEQLVSNTQDSGPAREGEELVSNKDSGPEREGEEFVSRKDNVRCHFGAEMPESPPLEQPAELTVIISREALNLTEGPASKTSVADVSPREPLSLEVVAKNNCAVIGDSKADNIHVPDPGGKETFDFKIKGHFAGPAELWVNIRQGARRLTRMVLQPTFISTKQLSVATVIDTTKADSAVVELRIIEEPSTQDKYRLRFIMSAPDLQIGALNLTREFNRAKDLYVQDVYAKMESYWTQSQSKFGPFLDAVRIYGASLYDEIFPDKIKAALWEHQDRIGCLQVVSEEPSIPWEMLHLVDSSSNLGKRFLGELGLVRWIDNSHWPPSTLHVRQGRCFHVVPNYANPKLQLRGAAKETAILEKLLKTQAVPGTKETIVNRLVNGGEIDLLHFACHGSANTSKIWHSALLLNGAANGNGTYAVEELSMGDIQYKANFRGAGGTLPLIFVNACQAGIAGRTLTGTGGMAQAFISKGAGLFISTLWSIGDDVASTFCEVFYTRLLEGDTVTQAARAAREAARTANEPTWLAYTIYGHPYARLSRE